MPKFLLIEHRCSYCDGGMEMAPIGIFDSRENAQAWLSERNARLKAQKKGLLEPEWFEVREDGMIK